MLGAARRGGGLRAVESHEARGGDELANAAPPMASVWRGRGWWLAGAGAEREGDVTPGVEKRCRRGQMEDDAAHGAQDMDAKFEQPLPQRGHLRPGARRARRPQPEFLHEHVRGGGEEHAQLIGPEATAAGASDLESVVEFLDPIFNVAACTVDTLVDEPRRLPQIRDHKARVVAGLPAREADDFGFDHDAALVGPRPGRITRLGVDVFGLPARLALAPGLDHGRLGAPRQHGVFRHRDDVIDAGLSVEPVEHLRCRKPAIQPHEEAGPGKRDPQHVEQANQRAPGPARRRRVARPEDRRTQVLLDVVVEGEERQQRQIAPAVVVAVEEGELLRAVGRVIGRVEIDRDVPSPPMQPLSMAVDDVGGEFAAHRIERLRPDLVFEAGDRGLRGERVSVDGITSEEELVDRVVREPITVVRIGMAAGESVDALRHQILKRVPHLPWLPIIDEASGKAINQPVARFRGLEQDRAAIRARVGLIERRDDGFDEEVWQENSLWYGVVAQSKASVWEKARVATALYHAEAFVSLLESAPS